MLSAVHCLLRCYRFHLWLIVVQLLYLFWLCFLQVFLFTIPFPDQTSYSSVHFLCTPWTAARQASPSINNSQIYSNSRPFSQWCYPTISSSVVPFYSHFQSFTVSGSFQMRKLFASGGQRIGVLASTSVLPMNIQDWFPLGWNSWISLQS